jgi:hypothetical protein
MIASMSFTPHGVDCRQVAPGTPNVHAEAEDEAVGHGQRDEIGLRRFFPSIDIWL